MWVDDDDDVDESDGEKIGIDCVLLNWQRDDEGKKIVLYSDWNNFMLYCQNDLTNCFPVSTQNTDWKAREWEEKEKQNILRCWW